MSATTKPSGLVPTPAVKLKWVLRYDPPNRLLRIARLMWQRGTPGMGHPNNYSAKLSIGLRPALFTFQREWDGWRITVLGVRVHFQRSYGGIFA